MGDNKTRGPQQQQNDPQRQSPGRAGPAGAAAARTRRAAIPAARPTRRISNSADEDRSVNVKEGPAVSAGPFSWG